MVWRDNPTFSAITTQWYEESAREGDVRIYSAATSLLQHGNQSVSREDAKRTQRRKREGKYRQSIIGRTTIGSQGESEELHSRRATFRMDQASPCLEASHSQAK